MFLNQAPASLPPGFLKLILCGCVCVRPPPRLLITSGMICTPYDWLNKFYSYMGAVVRIVSGVALASIRVVETKSKLALYKLLIHCNSRFKQLYLSNKKECFSYKGGCGVHGRMHIEAFKRRVGLGYRLTASGY